MKKLTSQIQSLFISGLILDNLNFFHFLSPLAVFNPLIILFEIRKLVKESKSQKGVS